MEDSALLSRMFENMAAYWGAVAASSPNGNAIEREGVTACLVPSLPHLPYLSLFNTLIFKSGALSTETLAELEQAFLEARIKVRVAWVHESDGGAADLFRHSGYAVVATNRAMARELEGPSFAPAGPPSDRQGEQVTAAAINEEAWGVLDGSFVRVLESFRHPDARLYLAELEGTEAACVSAFHDEHDCGIYFVATRPWARRRGLARNLMLTALAEAQAAGCCTTSLQASAEGEPLYRKLGYRDLGRLDLWERRPVATNVRHPHRPAAV
jgi:ribosomal protein S18 acetylase RimI-like enzyme